MYVVRGRVALMLSINDDDKKKVVWLTALMSRRRSTTACNRHHVNTQQCLHGVLDKRLKYRPTGTCT